MKKSKILLLSMSLFLLSLNAFSQDPGGNPDGPPPAVPFDDYLSILLVIAGVVFSLFALRKMQNKPSMQ